MKALLSFSIVIALCVLLLGCGGGGGGAIPATFVISPNVTGALVNQTVQLTAIQSGGDYDSELAWEVVGGAANGSVSNSGLYSAPSTPGTYQVRAYFKNDTAKVATATIKVATSVSVTVLPTTVKDVYGFGEKVRFTVDVAGADPSRLTWSVSPSTATVDNNGQFTASQTSALYTVTATVNTTRSSVSGKYLVLVSDTPVVKLNFLNKGDVYVRMAAAEAPNTTTNFINLASSGFYDGTYMHRYGPDEGQPAFIQGGDPNTKTLPLSDPSIGTGNPGYTINYEANALLHETGSIAMARSASRDSAGSQFYICQENIPAFDGNYVVFGKVVGGLDVAKALRRGDKLVKATVLR